MDREISTCLNVQRNTYLSKKGQRNISLCKRTEITSRLQIPNPSAEPQPELAEPEAEPIPPTICVLFAVCELLV